MSKWKYDGYTKVKMGSGKHARMIEKRIYICPFCNQSVRIEHMVKPPQKCPNCNTDMRGELNE